MFRKIVRSIKVRPNVSSFISYFMLSKLLLGYYFDLSKFKVYNTIIRCYCMALSGLVLAIAVKHHLSHFSSMSLVVTGQYIFGITACHFHNQKYFFKFCSTLKADSSVYIKSYTAEFVVLTIFLVYFTFFMLTTIELRFDLILFIYFFCIISCNLENVMVTLMFDLLRQRTTLLSKYAKKLEDHDVCDDEKLRILKKILLTHKNLLTNMKQNMKFVKPMVGLMKCRLYDDKCIMMINHLK